MRTNACLLATAILLGTATANGDAQTNVDEMYMCTFKTGESRLVWNGAPERYWERCAQRMRVLHEGFTTTNLTFGLSAVYDARTNRFSNAATGSTSEFIRPGEHVLILDAKLNGRHLAFSLSSNSFLYLNVLDIERKLIAPEEYERLKSAHSAEQLFISVEAAEFYKDSGLKMKSEIGRGRIFAWRGNLYDDSGREHIEVECLKPHGCKGVIGWIPKTQLSEIRKIERPTIPFPKTYEYPTRRLIKRCDVGSKIVRSSEIKAAVTAKAPFAKLIDAELSASIEAALKTVREETYEKDLKIERTVFTVFKFRSPGWFERNLWYPQKVRILIVDRVTSNCKSNNPKTHFELKLNDGSYEITEPRRNPDITSSVAYTRFVTQAQASMKGRVKVWALNFIASALSAQRRLKVKRSPAQKARK